MDTKRASDGEPSAVRDGVGAHRVSRRNFGRAGLSGSVLLGSLASKPVLGASVGCTVSGQMSGNLSREAQIFNCQVGKTPTYWLTATSWPSAFSKGTLPSNQCDFNGTRTRGTNFNGYTASGVALIDAFYNSSGGTPPTCGVVLTSNTNPATMLQVLNTIGTKPNDQKFQLGRIVVASLLNIASDPGGPGNYPVTYHTVIDMFNATFGGGNYVVGTVTWNRTRVIQYLESLVA